MVFCDADYEITATVKTLLSGEQKVKIAEGSIPIIPHLETVLAPSFEDGVEYTKEREVDGYGDELFKSRIFAFRPNGITIKTIPIGVAFSDLTMMEMRWMLYLILILITNSIR